MAELLGVLALAISIVALVNAIKADQRMRAIANLEYDAKLAILADHLGSLRAGNSLAAIERARNDLRAVSNLRKYASPERKRILITDYVIPIVQACVTRDLRGGIAVAVNEIIEIGLAYDIEVAELERLRQQVRGA